jgi:uncharacterized protein YndB with AHSA1/START domain
MVARAALPIALNLRRTFSAPPERMYRAFTIPSEVQKWWGPGDYTAPAVDIDLRVGGRFRITMKPPQGEVIHLTGVYREVQPPRRLVFTWQWEGDPVETLVTVEFMDRGGMTELVLTHERFPTAELCDQHKQGWGASLEKLPRAL